MNKFERYSIVAGITLSAISAMASAVATWQTAAQAKYAQQALTAADLNKGFSDFYDQWTKLCTAIDVTGGYVVFEVKSAALNHQMVVVEATDMGYPFEPIDHTAQMLRARKAMDEVVEAHDKLAMWLPAETLRSMSFEQVLTNLIILSRTNAARSEAKHYSAMFRQAGYCRLWKSWFMTWFKQGYGPTPDVDFKNIRLVFNTRDGSVLNDDYIREARKQPWDQIHRFAPP
ncbi:hypothetical protein NMA58_24270 (plasmid) [Rhizobium sp. YTUHZ045]|uniref:hypothetical protein n=1 Tax=Rhizobium sp. YTUHZ045 TaxID=2962888 RepID=UPI003DAA1C63